MAQPTRLRAQNTERKKVTKKINMSISIYSISHIRVISDYSTGSAESISLSVAATDEDIYIYIYVLIYMACISSCAENERRH